MRILLTRTDRIGDVVLSTPAIKALRQGFPDAHIAFMVRPYARDIVEGNPYLDEVIVYDKDGKHKNFLSTVIFVLGLRKKKFDKAIMLHPTNRVHLIAYLAGIPERVGYDRKLPFLLTKKFHHLKQEGKKHELEYTLDLLKSVGIEAKDKELFVPIHENDIERVEKLLEEYHVGKEAPLIAINPGSSCPSKRWPASNFGKVCDELVGKYSRLRRSPEESHEEKLHSGKARILIVSDNENKRFADDVAGVMRYEPVNLAGRTTVGELAALLSKCSLFISNDSGPVHIACAVGIPVISIFGRKDAGLSPKRWGPIGEKNIVLHKDVGCDPCLAHNCKIGFKCLEAVTPEEVLKAADALIIPYNPLSPPIFPYKKRGENNDL